jgi:hypothetical protein
VARRAEPRPGGHWRGKNGGQRRGKQVDAQITRIVNGGLDVLNQTHVYHLSRSVLAALSMKKLDPLVAQRTVASEYHRIGTAADIICYDAEGKSIVIVELKCGHDKYRKVAAVKHDNACYMKSPLQDKPDSTLNRHLAQLAITHALFIKEEKTMEKLKALGVERVRGMLLYAADKGVEWHTLSGWWKAKSSALLDAIK